MRKWKDNGSSQMAELTKATIIFLGSVNAFTVMYIFFSGIITPMQIFGLVTSAITIYLMMSGKMYQILKWYAERQSRKRDNKWR